MPFVRQACRRLTVVVAVTALASCDGEVTSPVGPPPPPPPAVLLKDVVLSNLPSPYYHFEYDAAHRITKASFAAGLRLYQVLYEEDRISEIRNQMLGNGDRLLYSYDDAGRVTAVQYVDAGHQVFTNVFLRYAGDRLTELERDRRVAGGFLAEKIMSFSYDMDGNVFEIRELKRTEEGVETSTVDRYEEYDGRRNVDAFTLLHDEFFDHLVLLPEVQLQKSNPGRVTHTGDGSDYVVTYRYTYDSANRPTVKSGDLRFTSGNDAGRQFAIRTEYSYY